MAELAADPGDSGEYLLGGQTHAIGVLGGLGRHPSKQAFFKWNADPVCQRDWDDAHLINAAIDIHHDDPEFGYRFIADVLAAGVVASRNRVNRLCTMAWLWSVHSRKRGRFRKPGPPVHDDLVKREFTATALWLTDITEHPTAEGKLYLCAVKDACFSRIVGYSIDARMTASFEVDALNNALAVRGRADALEAVVHPDRGSLVKPLARLRPRAARSPGPRIDGPSWDLRGQRRDGVLLQPAAEERLNRRRWSTREELRLAMVTSIENTYHRRRRQQALEQCLRPVDRPAGSA